MMKKQEMKKAEPMRRERKPPKRKKPERNIPETKKTGAKKIILIIAASVVLAAAVTALVLFMTNSTTASGTIGENATWEIKGNVLTISGEGDIVGSDYDQPWRNHTGIFSIVVVEEGITGIGRNSFSSYSNIKEVKLPSTLKTIGKSAFSYCRNLSDIEIPNGVESIGKWAFSSTKITTAAVPNSVTYLGSYAFDSCFDLESVSLSDSLTTVTRNMFQGDYSLKNVTLPKNLTIIGQSAFYGCSALESIEIPDTVTKINKSAFSGCSSLKGINLPANVKIGKGAFNNTPELEPSAQITVQPADVHLPAPGGDATVSITAEGSVVRYNWYYRNRGDTKWTTSTVHTASYTTTMEKWRYGRQVYCEVKDIYNRSVKSNTVTLAYETGLRITQQPTNARVNTGETATFKCVAAGNGLKYRWYYKNPNMSSFKKTSVTTDTYAIEMTDARNGRQMYCVVTDEYGAVIQSDTVTMTK